MFQGGVSKNRYALFPVGEEAARIAARKIWAAELRDKKWFKSRAEADAHYESLGKPSELVVREFCSL